MFTYFEYFVIIDTLIIPMEFYYSFANNKMKFWENWLG